MVKERRKVNAAKAAANGNSQVQRTGNNFTPLTFPSRAALADPAFLQPGLQLNE